MSKKLLSKPHLFSPLQHSFYGEQRDTMWLESQEQLYRKTSFFKLEKLNLSQTNFNFQNLFKSKIGN